MSKVARRFSEYGSKKDLLAKAIADGHYGVDSAVTDIYRIIGPTEDDPDDPIKFLEVDAEAIPAGIVPVYVGRYDWNFAPDGKRFRVDKVGDAEESRLPISVVVIDISPEEFEQLNDGKLMLRSGWELGDRYTRLVGASA